MQPHSVAAKMLHDHRRGALWWAVGLTAFLALEIGLYPSIRDQSGIQEVWRDMPDAMKAVFGLADDVDMATGIGFLEAEVFALMLPLALIGFAVALGGAAIGREEDRGTLDLLLAHPLSRGRLVASKALAGAVLIVGVGGTVLAAVVLGDAAVGLDVGFAGAAAAVTGVALLGLLFGAVALLATCAGLPRGAASAVTAAAAVAAFLVNSLASLTDVIAFVRPLSPFRWAVGDHPLRDGFSPWMALTLVAATVVVWLASALFSRRDLRS